MMIDPPSDDPAALAEELLTCPADCRSAWAAARRDRLDLRLVEALKQVVDQRLLSDPAAAGDAAACALEAAQHMPGESLALSLAAWARGNWEAYHDPQAAIESYERAVAGYRVAGDHLSVARLLANLVGPLADCGRFAAAEAAYQEAQALLCDLGPGAAVFLQALEQNYGWLLHTQGRYSEALAAHERAHALARRLDRLDIAAEVQVNRALTLGLVGRLAEGEAALLHERAVAEMHRQALTVARIDMNLGELYAALGRPAEALRRLEAARERFAALENRMEAGTALLCEAALFERIGALRDARRGYAHAHEHFAALGMAPYVGEALVRGAAANRRYGDFTRAARLLDEADALWRSLDQPLWLSLVALERAALALEQEDAAAANDVLAAPLPTGDVPALAAQRDLLLGEVRALQWRASGAPDARDAARGAFARALGYARPQGDRWVERQALVGLGRLALPDDPAAARDYLESAAAHDDLTRQALSVQELKAGFQAQTGEILPLLARLAAEQGQPLAALAYAWRAKGSALLDLLRAPDADHALPPAEQKEIEQLRQQLAGHRWQAAILAAGDAPEGLRERGDPAIHALEQRLHELRRARNCRQSAHAAAALADPPALLHRMEADALIEYLRCGDTILALCAGRDGDCRAVAIGDVEMLLDLLDELRLTMQNVVALPADRRMRDRDHWLDECRLLLRRCYELLIAPLGQLPDGELPYRLLIAPCDPLDLFPFAACWDGRCYLAERCEIQMTPSGALLADPPRRADTTGPPLIVAASAEGRLPGALAEAAVVGAALPGSVCLIDDPRSLDELAGLEAAPRLLHIAAHSLPREDAPIFSALQLAGGLLSVEQCYELPLAGAELVTLSGCATGAGLDSGGSLLAFQSALFVAGARRVLYSLWPIDDQATATWMGRFYQLLAAGLPPAAALRQTQRVLIDEPASCHPAIWAAFACSRRS
jgi:tetratricopeptide (TPR) repeat protein